ncbi:MAG TPA: radical SAM family heme chaperone HemW [Mycobacteriales bacterium]|nr:radical SAM family heme chaperone HemW [Mycobacteriales bacterium]
MPSTLPEGGPAPVDGALPNEALETVRSRPFGIYVHVPFCASRCGYCDFNTYTADELGGGGSQADYADTAIRELELARRILGDRPGPVETVFFGGGTPTLLPADDLVRIVDRVDALFGLADEVEVTTEANPESIGLDGLQRLRAGGFTRVSFGMQSAAEHVLSVLDRRHTPGRVKEAVGDAHAAGFEHVNVDLIYGTPGETDADWQHSLDAAIDTGVDHVSAYSLIVEIGTRLATRISRGELPMPDDDAAADRYLIADDTLSHNGFEWYEVSNWARSPAARSRHNLLYWTGGDWWGIGPGAHSHVGGVRWWNVKHPSVYAQRLSDGESPALGREQLDADARRLEDVMLRLRLREGLPLHVLDDRGRAAAAVARDDGLLAPTSYDEGVAVLTLRGRLLADAVVRDLLG